VSLLSPTDQQRLRDAFAELTRRVRLVFFTQTLDCETCVQARQILDELPPLSDKITIDEVNLVLDRDKAGRFGIDRVPAVAIVSQEDGGPEQDSRIRFLGTPSGYEFSALIHAVMLVGGKPTGLTEAQRQRLASIDRPVVMQVFTTPT
jgi:alkyl hydroperoxide reductase subunit AhpF